MENQVSSKSIIVNYGVILGAISISISVVLYALGMHLEQNWVTGVLGFLAMVIILVIGIKKFKESKGGFLTWGQAVKIGVGISVVSAILATIYNLIFINFIEPGFMSQMMEIQQQAWADAGMSGDQIEQSLEMAKKFQNPAVTTAIGILAAAFFGFIISAIAGAIMKESEEEEY